MSNEAVRYQILGLLAEQGEAYLKVAQDTEEHLFNYISTYVEDEDAEVRASKLMGMALAMFKLESLGE